MTQQNQQHTLEKPTFWAIPPSTLTSAELAEKSVTLKQRLINIAKRFKTCVLQLVLLLKTW